MINPVARPGMAIWRTRPRRRLVIYVPRPVDLGKPPRARHSSRTHAVEVAHSKEVES
jgi:hypothetical protein